MFAFSITVFKVVNVKLKFVLMLALATIVMAGGGALLPNDAKSNESEPGLPHAQGQSFATLDAYLAHLEKLGEIGISWYERMPDGRYRLIKRRMPGSEPEIYTRQELLDRFGFDE